MNRGSVGCSTESACGVELANRQDARTMCECKNGVNYMCGEDKIANVRVKESNNTENKLVKPHVGMSYTRQIRGIRTVYEGVY